MTTIHQKAPADFVHFAFWTLHTHPNSDCSLTHLRLLTLERGIRIKKYTEQYQKEKITGSIKEEQDQTKIILIRSPDLVLGSPGPSVRCSFGPLVRWSLVLWSAGPWFFGLLVRWSLALLLRWSPAPSVSWSSGHLDLVPWSPSPLVLWSFSLGSSLVER